MGYYDLPASIDYILNVTGRTQLSYIGHSMGTTMFFVLGSERPEYMNKVNAAVMLAPVGYLHNMRTPVLNLLHDVQDLLNVSTVRDLCQRRSSSALYTVSHSPLLTMEQIK